ncbi:hypothetical protein [Mangrovibacterium sp.]|uniref:HzsA-related protein n=1 Tax=Mangrovibacterium sp. TaxID=1961364 RepID=UPI0035676B32
MIRYLKVGKQLLFGMFIGLTSCVPVQDTTPAQVEWTSRLLELQATHQPINNSSVRLLMKELNTEYPAQTQLVLGNVKVEELVGWFDTENLLIDQLALHTFEKIKTYPGIFSERVSQIGAKNGAHSLDEKKSLIEEMIVFLEITDRFNSINFNALKAGIAEIHSRYPDQYKSKEFLLQLEKIEKEHKQIEAKLANSAPSAVLDLEQFVQNYEALKKEAVLSNPLVKNTPIVFVTRNQYAIDHHNTATLFQTNETNTNSFAPGGSMKIIDLKKGGKITTLLETTDGVIRDPEISYDGKKVLFSMRNNIDEDYHIYEMDVDGKNLKQLTAATGVADIDPQYLPNGDIVFSSTREPKYCMCNIHIMANLFKMEGDGANITQLGKSTLFEGHSTILPDGRILYDRWEYVDRNFGDAQGLWTMNPDGTNQAIYFGNNSNSPGGYIDARPIPGTDKVIAIMGSCHDRPWGALGIINREKGLDEKASVEKTWPASARELIGIGNWDTFKQVKPLYEDPFPLNDTWFLCSRSLGIGEQMGLFLIDIFGNEQLIYTEAPGCYDPIPIQAREKEYSIENKRNYQSETGQFYVQDVYQGTHMNGVERGAVKYLRVVESIAKRSWTVPAWGGQGVHRPAMNWHSFECKKIWGTVPVEEDGSAYVEVPADKYVYFQLLDEHKMMIQSMRSGTMVQSGETLGCIGCHDDRRMAPPSSMSQVAQALKNPPQKLNGWYGEPRTFGFTKEVQPVLDKHCVKCHDFGKKAGEKLVLAGDRNPYFNAAYMDMHMQKAVKPIGAGPAEIQQAYSWGSHPSKLVQMLKKGHANVKLSEEEMERITTWIDLNAVYYPDFISAYPNNPAGRSPISEKDLNRLGELTDINFKELSKYGRTLRVQIAFERPELSPCLKNIADKNSAEYKEALAIITKGKNQLIQKPRLDMEHFVPSETDKKRLEKYDYRLKEEITNREAIQNKEKHFDPELKRAN